MVRLDLFITDRAQPIRKQLLACEAAGQSRGGDKWTAYIVVDTSLVVVGSHFRYVYKMYVSERKRE